MKYKDYLLRFLSFKSVLKHRFNCALNTIVCLMKMEGNYYRSLFPIFQSYSPPLMRKNKVE